MRYAPYILSHGRLIERGGGTTIDTRAVRELEAQGIIKVVDRWRERGAPMCAYVLTAHGKMRREDLMALDGAEDARSK